MQEQNQSEIESAKDIYVNPEWAEGLTTSAGKEPLEDAKEEAKSEVETPAPEAEVKTEEKPKEPEAPKKRDRVNERIGEITAARREAERKYEAEQKRAQALEARLAELEKTLTAPSADDYSDSGAYAAAVAKYEAKKSAIDDRRADAKQALDQSIEDVQVMAREAWAEKVRDAEERIPNFKEILAKAPDIAIPPHLESEIMDSDLGPELLLHLAQNPREAMHLGRLSPKALSREILKLEMRLEDSAKAETPKPAVKQKVSAAPTPPDPITARSSSLPEDDFSRWMEKRNKEAKLHR